MCCVEVRLEQYIVRHYLLKPYEVLKDRNIVRFDYIMLL
jgi:hypothetical protein